MTARDLLAPRRRVALLASLALFLLTVSLAGGSTSTAQTPHILVNPYRPSHQTRLTFGERSHWLQPWRGYLSTVPARRLTQALGIVFNPPLSQANRVAKQVAEAGLRRARLEISWCRVTFSDPPQLTGLANARILLNALRTNNLRPLVLLNGHHGCPGPLRKLTVNLAAPARAGDREVVLDPASIAQIVPGKTGLDSTAEYKAAAYLFTKVSGTRATLSRPLDLNLNPGSYSASTLRYAPLVRPGHPQFEETMQGWISYVGLVTSEVKRILGSDQFDVEVWNELSFGSDFLDAATYYTPTAVPSDPRASQRELLERTITYIRDPSHGLQNVGIGDGFSTERPWEAGSNVPAGLTAIDKHPYPPRRSFPQQAVFNKVRPVDALGRSDGSQDAAGRWRDSFIPTYTSFFPEYFLSGIQTETVIRDLSPITTDVYGTPHGRSTHPPGAPPPVLWVTEAGMDPSRVPAAVLPRFHAKGALRWATAWVNKGVSALYFYAVSSPGWGIVEPNQPDGGATLRALRRLNRALEAEADPISRRRALRLIAVSDTHNQVQFAGDGTQEHPPLYDRDVIGFFPFQSANRRVVVAMYVMTRDLMRTYRPSLPEADPRRYDMPPEWFRITIAGTAGIGRKVALTDPLTGKSAASRVVSRRGDRLVVDVPLTDSPRLLVLS